MKIQNVLKIGLCGLVLISAGAGAEASKDSSLVYLSCEYEKPAELNNSTVDLIVDTRRNTVTTSLDCKATGARINDVHIAFQCGDDFSMNVDRLTGAFNVTLPQHQRGSGHCLKIKKPKF